jgi:alpha-L-rhamnosidase
MASRIESSWTLERGVLRLDVTVPPGTTAEVVLPGGQARRVGPGRHSFAAPAAVAAGQS